MNARHGLQCGLERHEKVLPCKPSRDLWGASSDDTQDLRRVDALKKKKQRGVVGRPPFLLVAARCVVPGHGVRASDRPLLQDAKGEKGHPSAYGVWYGGAPADADIYRSLSIRTRLFAAQRDLLRRKPVCGEQ